MNISVHGIQINTYQYAADVEIARMLVHTVQTDHLRYQTRQQLWHLLTDTA